MLKKIINRILPLKFVKQFRNFSILASKYGQYKTIKNNKPIDKNNEEIPWYTYPAIEYLNHLDFSEKSIFEWGSGYSSVYWARNAKEVISIESDNIWYKEVLKLKKNNQTIEFIIDKKEYLDSILKFDKKFDVIVIDDRFRNDCVENAVFSLKDNGFIILDNSDWFNEAIVKLRSKGFIQVDFHGFGPINDYTWTTSIFFNKEFCFDYKLKLKSIFSIEKN
jgi:hypothetical protein